MDRIPLVELHTHLEGAVSPQRLLALAERHGLPEAPRACLTAEGSAYRFDGFGGFLEAFKWVTACLRTPVDYREVALDLGEALAHDGVVYAEVIIGFGVMLHRGIDPLPVQRALADAAAEIEARWRVRVRWLPDAVRQFGVDAAWRALEVAEAAGRRLGVVGFGIGGDETALPAEAFADLCAEARRAGLGVALHAGEVAGPASVRQAVEACGATRIGHGVAAAGDPAAMARLLAAGTLVELCPGSNLRTGVVAAAQAHPLRAFLDAGIRCCLNTDDRAMMGLTLAGEHAWAQREHGLTAGETATMQRQALQASFADSKLRECVGALLR